MNVQGSAVQTQADRNKPRPGFHHATVRGLSLAVLILGVLCFLLGIAVLVIALTRMCKYEDWESRNRYYDLPYDERQSITMPAMEYFYGHCHYSFTYVSPGLWCGLMCIASGIIGVLAAQRKTTCFIVSMMVLSIIAAPTAGAGVAISIISNFDYSGQFNTYPNVLIVLNSIVALSSLICLVLSFIKFGYACRAVCCNGSFGIPLIQKRAYSYQPIGQINPAPPMQMQGAMPVFQQAAPQQNMMQPIYLVQGHQIIGMLPPNAQQQYATSPNVAMQSQTVQQGTPEQEA